MVRIRSRPKRISAVITLTQLILEKLMELGEVALDAFFPAKYPEARLWRKILGLDPSYEFSTRSFSVILSRLKRQGLVARRGSNRKTLWAITDQGKALLRPTRGEDLFEDLPPRDGVSRLVIFDIPERERKKRDAVRRELLACDFRALQKSVWIGYRPLPEDFLELLDELGLHKHVHILTVRDGGTIGLDPQSFHKP